MKIFSCIFLVSGLTVSICSAQIRVSSTNVDNWIKANFGGQGIIMGNVKHGGNPVSQASFTSSANVLQVQKGLMLSTGNVYNVAGFNNSHNLTAAFGSMNQPETDADLSKLLKERLYDISYVEFDFVPLGNSVQFNYQFGSDEYPEYVGTAFNDIFAFFISDDTGIKNIALVPGKDIPVSINNINTKSGAEFFIDNNPFSKVTIKRQPPAPEAKMNRSFFGGIWHGIKKIFTYVPEEERDRVEILPDQNLVKKLDPVLYRNLRYDGITKKLVAQTYVEPYKKYHLKIIISDVSDNIYDSGVFIEDRSLTAKRDTLQPGYVNYPDLEGLINPKLILDGKSVADILPDSITLKDAVIHFDFDKSDISATEMEKVKSAAAMYERIRSKYDIYLTGHTDSIGNLDYNFSLSKRRNQAVSEAINKMLQKDLQMNVMEKAYLEPAADNGTDTGRHENRRVVITFKKRKE